mgnify:FL=1
MPISITHSIADQAGTADPGPSSGSGSDSGFGPRRLLASLHQQLRRSADLLLPRACALCGQDHAGHTFCVDCIAALPGLTQARCPVCAIAVPARGSPPRPSHCPACTRHRPAFDAALVLADYAVPLDRLIQAAKYRRRPQLARAAAATLAALRQADLPLPRWPQRIVPVPLNPGRLRERGFNQAAVAARALASAWRLPLDLHSLQRCRATATQQHLPLRARHQNVADAFVCGLALTGERVALVDDVMTSGATLHWAAHALREAGAASVIVLALARTPAPRQR